MKKILVTAGNSRFANSLKKIKTFYNFIYTTKKQLDITNLNSINECLKRYKPNYVLHLAGLSRPMSIHDKNIKGSF